MATKDPTWDHYRTFLALIEEGSLSAAARRLGLTQPTAGRQLATLERALGVALFTRSVSGLRPTEAALALRPHAETLKADADALFRAASGSSGKIDGTVRITASEMIGTQVLPPILTALRIAHPALAVELALSDKVQDLLRREADIAIRMTSVRQLALVVKRVGDVAVGLYAHREYLRRCGQPASADELRHHSLIGFDTEAPYVRMLTPRAFPHGRPEFALRCDNTVAQFEAIRAGFGIGFCQVGLARRERDLIRILPEIEVMFETSVIMHEDLRSSGRMRVVFDALVRGLSSYLAAPAQPPSALDGHSDFVENRHRAPGSTPGGDA